MAHAKVGAGALLVLLIAGAASPVPSQETKADARSETAKKPGAVGAVDSAAKSIGGYDTKASTLADDGEFLRRAMLDLVGYPPNLQQVKAFMADPSPNKRTQKIHDLVETDDWADLWTRQFSEVYFGDYHEVVMDTMPKLGKEASARIVKDFMGWFKRQLIKETPYTDVVRYMLDARGTDEGDPALAYKLSFYKEEGQAIEFANGVARHMLGIRLLCARCHDHPFDRWTVQDYYGLAAFNVRQRVRGFGNGGEKDSVGHVEVKYADEGEMEIQRSPDANDKDAKVKLAQGGKADPVFLFGGAAGKNDDRAKVLGQLLTSKANTQLPRAMVNRVWSFLFGRGIVHPVDDFNLRNKALSPALLDNLTRAFVDSKYSVKELVKLICNTDVYQRSCNSDKTMTKVTFDRCNIKQLTGEQLINSVQVATQGKPGRNIGEAKQMTGQLFPAGTISTEVTPLPGNARQALLLRNNTTVSGWVSGGGVLSGIKGGAGSVDDKIKDIFLAALSRLPNDAELARYKKFIEGHQGSGWEDAYWTLLNSSEFVTRH
ncbi:MAG TPA: DUF1549 domain-containing protein [Planctomycetota bacterium]